MAQIFRKSHSFTHQVLRESLYLTGMVLRCAFLKPLPRKLVAVAAATVTAASAIAYAQLAPNRDEIVLFEADVVNRSSTESPIIAEGNVKAYFGEQFLTSDKVIYNPATDIVIAAGNVSITDTDGLTYFADEVELTGDLADGIATNFSAMLENNSKLAGNTVIKTGDEKNELSRAVYTSCEVCSESGNEKRPTWQVKALRVTQDKEDEVIRFRDARLEVLGVPALYLPYMQIPEPSVERQSGFLTPDFGTTTQQGFYLETPYYIAISDSQDATVSTKVMERQGVLYIGEYRAKAARGEAVLQGGIIDTREKEILERANSIGDQNPDGRSVPGTRFHFFGEAEYRLPGEWRAGFDANYVSDKFYILTYDVLPRGDLRSARGVFRPDRLTNNVYLKRRTENTLFSAEFLGFESLRITEDNDNVGHALPRIQYNANIFGTPLIGGQTNFNASFVALARNDGVSSQRITMATQWDRIFTSSGGHRFKLYAELRGDAYSYSRLDRGSELCNDFDSRNTATGQTDFEACLETFPGQGQEESTSKSRLLPTAGLEWSYPLVRRNENSTIIIEPKIQLITATDEDFNSERFDIDGDRFLLPEIVNEDSQFFQFDTTSLFDWNKSSGYDLWENGNRANIGLNASAVFDNGLSMKGAIGQQFRDQETTIYEAYGLTPGLGATESDIVGSFRLSKRGLFNFDNRFRFDKDDASLRRAESNFTGRFGRFATNLSYVKVETIEVDETEKNNEFLVSGVSYNLTDNWTVGARQRNNISRGNVTQQVISLGYRDECSRLLLAYRIDNTNAGGLEFGDSLTINLELTGFGN
ncbi:LPS-assembly protein LptD [Parvularcula sp. IMCC14364]|uniref:LPS-assembly protein LptD n=1 Tax=Parvularcula sp. IMCC14364 TaxID=3067902 RepID=UPI002741716C|nr:LPS assembly protein LptD [Parvularcula sp. IMCC14364]